MNKKEERIRVRAIEGAEGSVIEKYGDGKRPEPKETASEEEMLAALAQEDEDEEASTPDTEPPKAEEQG